MSAILAAAALVPLPTFAQSSDAEWTSAAAPDTDSTAAPPSPAPSQTPPAPPENPPAPPSQAPAASPSQTDQQSTAGQWVYTQQYGWVWMPYGDAYSYVPPEGWGEPYEYVYYPVYGWTWIVAPWVWGIGPWPYFAFGPSYFGWYHHGWWRTPWRWHYVPRHAWAGDGFRPVYRGGARSWGWAPRGAFRPSYRGGGIVRQSAPTWHAGSRGGVGRMGGGGRAGAGAFRGRR